MEREYGLRDKVTLALSGERGVIIAINQSIDHPPQHYVRYTDATGVQREDWFFASALNPGGN